VDDVTSLWKVEENSAVLKGDKWLQSALQRCDLSDVP